MNPVFFAVLQTVPGIGSANLRKLVEYFGTGENIWKASDKDIRLSRCINAGTCDALAKIKKQSVDVDTLQDEWVKKNIKLCSYWDDTYPEPLKNSMNPPVILFYRGSLEDTGECLAIVGARKASNYGKNIAMMFGKDLAKNDVTVVSGAAKGIDTAAHQGALSVEHGKTIAVLGCGVDVVYPRENEKLLASIAEHGAVVSEYMPGTQPNPKFFPARNRIISGLSRGVIVVEAGVKSGSLITAEFALEENRDVFAVPGSIFSNESKGCHKLLKQGAALVENVSDIFAEYKVQRVTKKKVGLISRKLSEEEKLIYDSLDDYKPMSIDEIILKTRSDVSNINFILLQMELSGLVVECSPRCYVRAIEEAFM